MWYINIGVWSAALFLVWYTIHLIINICNYLKWFVNSEEGELFPNRNLHHDDFFYVWLIDHNKDWRQIYFYGLISLLVGAAGIFLWPILLFPLIIMIPAFLIRRRKRANKKIHKILKS